MYAGLHRRSEPLTASLVLPGPPIIVINCSHAPTRRRRIVRRAVMALAVPVLLLCSYVSGVLVFVYTAHAGWLPGPVVTSPIAQVYVTPLMLYSESGLPGSRAMRSAIDWSGESGRARK